MRARDSSGAKRSAIPALDSRKRLLGALYFRLGWGFPVLDLLATPLPMAVSSRLPLMRVCAMDRREAFQQLHSQDEGPWQDNLDAHEHLGTMCHQFVAHLRCARPQLRRLFTFLFTFLVGHVDNQVFYDMPN
mgnify:CR=1 FL=1